MRNANTGQRSGRSGAPIVGMTLVVALCAAVPSYGQSCNYGESASGNCLSPRVIPGDVGQHVVLMDARAATNTGVIGNVSVGNIVYFEFVPAVSGPVTISTCHPNTLYDTVVGLYRRLELCQFQLETYNDDTYSDDCTAHCTGSSSQFTWNVTAGVIYTIMVGSYNSNPQGCPLCLGLILTIGQPCGDPPRNFICDVARQMSGAPGAQYATLDTRDAIGTASWPCQSSVGRIVWYRMTPQVSGSLTVDTCRPGTNYDTVVSVWHGSCGALVQDGCADDPGCSYHSTAARVTVSVQAGVEYLIAIGGYAGGWGCLDVMFDLAAVLPGACCYGGGPNCVVTDQITCERQYGGQFKGAGTDCSDRNGNGMADICEPATGACCHFNGTCTILSRANCFAAGGAYQGDGISCQPNPCPNSCESDVQPPIAALDWGDFQCVAFGQATPINGTASDPENHLADWALEERAMSGASWSLIASGTSPVAGTFTNWTPANPGYRMIRLTVRDLCGHSSTAVRLVYADRGPQAVINSPGNGSVVGGDVCVDGFVGHGVCSMSWILERRPSGGSWTTLASGSNSIYNLTLATWNTLSVPDGAYDIRLTATSIGGSASQTVQVIVDNTAPTVQLTTPVNCATVAGVVPVNGVVSDANLASWALQWSGGPSHAWNTIQTGSTPINGLIANWNVASLPDCAYALRLIAWDRSSVNCTGNTHQSEYLVLVRKGTGGGGSCDVNGDGRVDGGDIQPLVNCLLGG